MDAFNRLHEQAKVFAALKVFQEAIQSYRRIANEAPFFLISSAAPKFSRDQLAGCMIHPVRNDILSTLKPGGIGVEVGTQTGAFARIIMDVVKPAKLFLLDIDYTPFRRELLGEHIESGQVELREGSSWELLDEFPDEYFDFAYIDAGHGYDMVRKDLDAAIRKVKSGGKVICNDFVIWSALEAIPYGVHTAVSEVIVEHKFKVTDFAMHPLGFFDIAFEV